MPSEDACFAEIKRFLSYMPAQRLGAAAGASTRAIRSTAATRSCVSIVPKDRRRPYNMKKLIGHVVDRGSFFEIQPTFGKALITGLARMNGKVVGVIANNPMVYGGAMDVKAARKQIHFVEMCDCFHIPLIFFVDVPGFMVGKDAEMAATLREGMRAVYVGLQATVPMYTVVMRKCYGMAGMGTTDKNGLDLKIAWPSAEWGSLPIEGGVAAAFRRDIASRARSEGARAGDRGGAASRLPRRSAPRKPSASRRSSIRARRGPTCAASSMRRRGACAQRLGPKAKYGVRP